MQEGSGRKDGGWFFRMKVVRRSFEKFERAYEEDAATLRVTPLNDASRTFTHYSLVRGTVHMRRGVVQERMQARGPRYVSLRRLQRRAVNELPSIPSRSRLRNDGGWEMGKWDITPTIMPAHIFGLPFRDPKALMAVQGRNPRSLPARFCEDNLQRPYSVCRRC